MRYLINFPAPADYSARTPDSQHRMEPPLVSVRAPSAPTTPIPPLPLLTTTTATRHGMLACLTKDSPSLQLIDIKNTVAGVN